MTNKLRLRSSLNWLGAVAVFVLGLSVMAVSPQAQAADGGFKGLMVSPSSNKINLKNSQVYTGTMKVSNTTDKDMPINMSVGTYTIQNDNYSAPLYSSPSKYSIMKDWIRLDKTSFTVKANDATDVHYTIVAPANPPEGTQYASIFAETEPSSQGAGISATSRVGLIVSANMVDGKTNDKSVIQNEKINGFQPNPPLKASFAIKNEGNIGVTTKYKLIVKNAINGSSAYESDETTSDVYPETNRGFSVTWDKPGIGFYNVELKINANGRDHTVKKLVCTVPVWIFILAVLAIAGLVGYFVINYRMRQEARGKKSSKKTSRR